MDKKHKCLDVVTSLSEFQDMLKKIRFLILPFESGNWGKRREKRQKIEWIEKKNIFQNF